MADAPKDAKIEKYEPPKELESKAAVQKFMGRPKRQPVEQAEYFYNVKATHILMFLSSVGMLISFLMMFDKDYRRPWKDYQKQFAEMDFEKLWYDMNELEAQVQKEQDKIKAIDAQIDTFLANFPAPGEEGREFNVDLFKAELPPVPGLDPTLHVTVDPDKAKKKLAVVEKEKIRGRHYLLQQRMNFAKDELGAVRYRFEEARHHYEDAVKKGSPRVSFYESHFLHEKAGWERVNKEVDERKKEFDEIDKRNTFYGDFADLLENRPIAGLWDKPGQKPLGELKKERALIVKELEEKELRYLREKPSLANKIRNAPGLDFFKPPYKVEQKILPDLKDQLNFTRIEKVDRCHTCHVGIGNPTYAVYENPNAEAEVDKVLFKEKFLRDFVAHARGTVEESKCVVCAPEKRKEEEMKAPLTPHKAWTSDDAIRFTKVFMAHPRLDLFVEDSSKHPIAKVGCTICHEGDGRDTDFTRVVHTPNSPKQGQDWRRRHGTPYGEERYNWNYRELWDLPMFPSKYIQASCRRCHTDAVELDGGEKYVEGMKILERAGCYGCHRVDTYQILEKDLKNPNIHVNRKNRRPGPPLTRIATKTTEDWAAKWVLGPRDFRPTTRMPHFFRLSNTRHEVNQHAYPPQVDEKSGILRSPVDDTITASIVKYIWAISDSKADPEPPGALKGDPKKGELLVRQVGCTACHKIEETAPEVYQDRPGRPATRSRFLEEFAPTLTGVGSKMNKTWLYHWVKNPKMHFRDSSMPNLRLTEQDAADVVEYLMTLKKPEWEKVPPPQANMNVVKDLCRELLRKSMPDVDVERVLAGNLIGKAEEATYKEFKSDEGRVKWLGRKMVKNYGCYSCHLLKTEDDKDVALKWDEEEGIGVELSGSQPFGSKHHDRLDFGFAADDGVNHHGVTFKHGFTGDEIKANVHEGRHYWLENKLENPRLFDGGKMAAVTKDGTVVKGKPWDELLRMPWFDFNKYEIERVATFVLSFTDHGVAGLIDNAIKRPNPDEFAQYRGDRIVRENNCRSCHRMSLDRFKMEYVHAENGKSKTERVWVEGRFGREDPDTEGTLRRLGLLAEGEDLKKSGKRLFTYSWTTDPSTLAMPGVVNPDSKYVYFDGRDEWYLDVQGGKVKRVKILRHVPQDGGDVLPQIQKFKRDLSEGKFEKLFGDKWTDSINIDDPSSFESRYPPMLRSQGVKTQADWLYRFLKQPYPIRPTLAPLFAGAKSFEDVNFRMPTFEFTDEEANAVVKWFAVRDHMAGKDFYPHTEIPERIDPKFSERKAAMDKAGPVVKDTNQGCASCHYIAGKAPPGDILKHAPDLARVEERLRPRWLYEWQDTPANIYPGTTMTTYDFKALFGGNQRDGVEAAVQYMLNFNRLNPTRN